MVARVTQPYAERRWVPWLGREVDPGETVEVPDRDLTAYLEAGWTEHKAPAAKTKSKES